MILMSIVGSRLDGYLTMLRERDHHLSVYRNAIKDWSKIYFGAVYDLPGESHEAPPAPPIQKREPSLAISVDSINSIEFDNRGDIEFDDRGKVDFVPPEREISADESMERLDDSVSESPRTRSSARKRNNPTNARDSALSSITESNGGDDDETDDDAESLMRTPTPISPSSKRRRVATNYSLSVGVRTRLNQAEKQNGFSVLDPLVKEGISWSSITDRYNSEFGTHRSVESMRAVWDRLSLNPKSTEGATAIPAEAEPFIREGSSTNTVLTSTPEVVSSSTASANKRYRSMISKSRRKLGQRPSSGNLNRAM